jgi:signal transduction histidine kinase
MNKDIQSITELIEQSKNVGEEEKKAMLQFLKAANKELELIQFKLERTEKVKYTTGILLEETIEELEQKRKSVEKQKRGLEIEAALERVRSRTMGMQKSDELADVAEILFKQVRELGIQPWTAGFNIWLEGNEKYIDWITDPSGGFVEPYTVDLTLHPGFRQISEAKKRGEDFKVFEISGTELVETYELLSSFAPKQFAKMKALANSFPTRQFNHYYFGAQVGLMFITPEPHPEDWDIFKRFGQVFEQTYTRFLDLKKAEEQAKEAKIEAGLERVRSKTMSMHNSQDVGETVALMFEELVKLEVKTNRCGILILSNSMTAEVWTAKSNPNGKATLIIGKLDLTMHPLLQGFHHAWENKESVFTYPLIGDDLISYYQAINNTKLYPTLFDLNALPSKEFHTDFYFTEGSIFSFTDEILTEEAIIIFKRFAGVFGQTYRRYLDLQKAEAQAREAQIETALEKVRSRSLAMQKGNEIVEVLVTIQEKLVELHVNFDSVNILIFSKLTKDVKYWTVISKDLKYIDFDFPYVDYSVPKDFSIARANHLNIFSKCYAGAEKDELLHYMFEQSDFRYLPDERKEYLKVSEYFTITIGIGDRIGIQLNSYTRNTFTDEENAILQRFTKVFEQAYIRFLDIQNAEVQALEELKRASVDRVRAEIASMRTSTDLERITPIIWNELTTLGVPFIRCGVFIMDEENQQIQTMLSTAEGKAIASFQLPFENSEPLTELIPHWRRMEIYQESWDEKTFIESTKLLLQRGAISSPETYATEHPPTNLHLHFLPFLQGMLYVGNETALNKDELQLVQNLADAFSIAYARYEDFNKLESAKEQIEKTLKDLKATQSLLIQSEKMASLGELTAGIAHEIQNPLNFVNNFSEVSTELVDEMNEEIQKGNLEDAQQIAADLKDNLSKINYHGKRAGDIVRGMLQHSRSSSGQKEPTDINALADEYLRLAYHGLRAKDKSFNATMNTDFDPFIGLVNIIPQDIGRVILNLITNAFYVVAEKKKSGIENYNPTVSVTTKKIADKILISVKDNGNGIPQKVLDKIFQPFFTTKPTGQGTGLGLSLSYDIVKAHGGELKVETKEGEGTVFIIQLPS